MAQCHAERRKNPSAMDFYVGALHSKLNNSSSDANKYHHWPGYNNATPLSTGFSRSSQSFRAEQSRHSLCTGSFRESTVAVNPSVEPNSPCNVSCTAASETIPHTKIVDTKLVQSVHLSHHNKNVTVKSLTSKNNGVSTAKDTKLSSNKVSYMIHSKVEENDSFVCARGTACFSSQPPAKEIKSLNAGHASLSSNGITTTATVVKEPICNEKFNNFPRIYKSAELGGSFSSKGTLRTGCFDAGNRLYKSGEQIVVKGTTNAGNAKECFNGGLIVGSQRVGVVASGDSSSSIGGCPRATKDVDRRPSGATNGSADFSLPTGGSPTMKDGGRKASFTNSRSSDGGSPMAKEMPKRSLLGGYTAAVSPYSGNASPTAKDVGRGLSTGNVINGKDAPISASVRGMGNILSGSGKLLNSNAGCNDNKVGDYPLKKYEDPVVALNTAGEAAPNRTLGILCTGNWSSTVSNSNSHGMATKAHNKPGEEIKSKCEPVDPEELKTAGNDQYRMGHFLEAVALYDKSIALRPTQAPYRSNRAAALTGLGRLGEAVLECEEAIKLDPGYSRAHQRAGHLYLRLGLIESAKRHLQAGGVQDDPKEAQALQTIQRHISRCIEARKVGDWRNVLRESNAALSAGADSAPQVLGYKAEAFLKLHRLQEAEGVCAIAQRHEHSLNQLGVAPADSFLYMLQAHIEMSLGRFESAIGAAEAAVKIDPRNLDAAGLLKKTQAVGQTRTLGNELFKAGKLFEACAVYGEGLESEPTSAVLLYNRAVCRSKLGQWEKAIEDCDAALMAQPHYMKALMRRAHCNAKLERWEDALRDYEVLRVEMPNDMEVARGYFDVQVALTKSRGEEIHKMKLGGEVEEVFNEDQLKAMVNLAGLSVVQFITRLNDRCCQISPFIDKLCKSFPCVHFLKVDVEDSPCLAKTESITFIPTFKIYKSGQKLKELLGPSEQALEWAVRHYSL